MGRRSWKVRKASSGGKGRQSVIVSWRFGSVEEAVRAVSGNRHFNEAAAVESSLVDTAPTTAADPEAVPVLGMKERILKRTFW